jgi:hypothetical protein
VVRNLHVCQLSGRDDSYAAFAAVFSGTTANRLASTRSLILEKIGEAPFDGRLNRMFDMALEKCRNVQSLQLVLVHGSEPNWNLLSSLGKLQTLQIFVEEENGFKEMAQRLIRNSKDSASRRRS